MSSSHAAALVCVLGSCVCAAYTYYAGTPKRNRRLRGRYRTILPPPDPRTARNTVEAAPR